MADILALMIPILAVLLIFGGPVLAIWTKHQQKLAEMQVAAIAEKAAQYASQSRELEERVRVLERIVTDKGYDIGRQIEALRDTRQVEHHDRLGQEARR